jgi:Cof subfamily protein (haloacid dehalogenase superfamily)
MVALDLDDTLLNSKLEVSPRVKQAIFSAREKGVLVTLATGRMYASTLIYAKELEVNIPLITYQGALIKDSQTGETLLHRPVPLELAKEIIQEYLDRGLHFNVYIDDKLYVDSGNKAAEDYTKLTGIPYIEVGNLFHFISIPPTKLLIVEYDEEKIKVLEEEFKLKYQGLLHITRSKPYFLEFLHPLANKASALEFLAQEHQIKREEVMAVGDSYNDLEMIEYAGFGVVMGNAPKEIQVKADFVTKSNDEDGVAEAIEKFCL